MTWTKVKRSYLPTDRIGSIGTRNPAWCKGKTHEKLVLPINSEFYCKALYEGYVHTHIRERYAEPTEKDLVDWCPYMEHRV